MSFYSILVKLNESLIFSLFFTFNVCFIFVLYVLVLLLSSSSLIYIDIICSSYVFYYCLLSDHFELALVICFDAMRLGDEPNRS